MGRSPCCEKRAGLKKGPWTPGEDQKLIAFIQQHGHGSWRALPAKAGLQRCGKSCRLRWANYLRPDIKRGNFTLQEDQTIIQLHALLGNRWSAIAGYLPKRTDNEIKNYWNTHLKKRLTRMGIDPVTHKPRIHCGSGSKDAANLSHIAQWESARLEAEARLVKESKSQLGSSPARLVLNKILAQQQRTSLPPCLDVLKAWQSSWSNSNSNSVASTTKESSRMHSMLAMMLASDNNLESPTSTFSFPEAMISSTTSMGLINENFNILPPTTIPSVDQFNKSDEEESEVIMKEAGDQGEYSLRHFNQQNVGGELISKKRSTDDVPVLSCLQDDDIMVAVEAFRSRRTAAGGGRGGHENNTAMEDFDDNDLLVFDPNENLAKENMDQEDNKHYWNSLAYLVNDSLSGSLVL